jgi:hypothetical protein
MFAQGEAGGLMHVNRVFPAGGKGLDYRERNQFTEQAIGFLRCRL